MQRHGWLVTVLTIGLVAGTAVAASVPVNLAVRILFKALSYDEHLVERCGDGVHIGVVVLAGDGSSASEGAEVTQEIAKYSDKKLKGLSLRSSVIELRGVDELFSEAAAKGINTLYLAQGPSASQCREIFKRAASRHWLVMSRTLSLVELGAGLGVFVAEGKPKIAVNATGAQEQGAHFDSGLLSMSEVFR